jgi:hypothetical protein
VLLLSGLLLLSSLLLLLLLLLLDLLLLHQCLGLSLSHPVRLLTRRSPGLVWRSEVEHLLLLLLLGLLLGLLLLLCCNQCLLRLSR